jgi:lysophospholipase L1-like esterase
MNRFLIFFTFLIGYSNLVDYTSPSHFSTFPTNKYTDFKPFKDTLYAKNLDVLSQFSDTLIIKRFFSEIQTFNIIDSIKSFGEVDIVFTGSSSIRKWETLEQNMASCNVLNRGFGGSTIPEVIYFSDELIFKHHPSKIVLYAGENDITSNKTNEKKVMESFIYFQRLVKKQSPEANLYFISIKPSPSRKKWWPKMQTINKMIKQYCDSTARCNYIDVSTKMFTLPGEIRKDIFQKDSLHLNQAGYKIWSDIIGSALECKVYKRL